MTDQKRWINECCVERWQIGVGPYRNIFYQVERVNCISSLSWTRNKHWLPFVKSYILEFKFLLFHPNLSCTIVQLSLAEGKCHIGSFCFIIFLHCSLNIASNTCIFSLTSKSPFCPWSVCYCKLTFTVESVFIVFRDSRLMCTFLSRQNKICFVNDLNKENPCLIWQMTLIFLSKTFILRK